jgi:glycine hydroxymethyltransferase
MENELKPDWYAKSLTWKSPEELTYFNHLRKKINWNNPRDIYRLIKKNYYAHNEFREKNCINLIASENLMSPLARKYLGSNLGFRVCDGPVGKKIFGSGIQFLEEIEAICIETARKLFGAKYVEHRLLSGTMGCMAIHYTFSKKGDVVMSQSSDSGGVVCNRPEGPSRYIGSKVIDIPWDNDTMNIDLDAFEVKVKEFSPKLIILGAMVTLFPYPLNEVYKIANEIGAVLAYDGAHIGGLVAGNKFQDPLKEGADLLMVNTHKQMGGPPGALILSNEEKIARKISETTFPFLVATPYCNRFASLAVTLAELLQHGEKFAEQIVRNAKTLGAELDKNGINVLCKEKGYTESHQIMLNIKEIGQGPYVEKKLADAYIISNKMPLPGDLWNQYSGLRLGVNEITRRGMKEDEMKQIASFIGDILIEDRSPTLVSNRVVDLMSQFQTVKYVL